MLKKILLAAVVVIAALLAVIAAQPGAYSVSRAATIQAPPATVYALISDFQKWNGWSPWGRLDPNMKETFSGPSAAPGSVYEWAGNSQVGRGRMTILEARPGQSLRISLEFIEPFPSQAQIDFALQPNAGATHVSWTMSGKSDFLSKAMCLFMGGMDSMIGPDFERGLRQLKSAAEAAR